MTYYIFSESAGQNLVNERYCNVPSISNASFGHERSGSLLLISLFPFIIPQIFFFRAHIAWRLTHTAPHTAAKKNGS